MVDVQSHLHLYLYYLSFFESIQFKKGSQKDIKVKMAGAATSSCCLLPTTTSCNAATSSPYQSPKQIHNFLLKSSQSHFHGLNLSISSTTNLLISSSRSNNKSVILSAKVATLISYLFRTSNYQSYIRTRCYVYCMYVFQVNKGSVPPPFTLKDQDGKTVSLSKFKGKPLVLYFYPADETPGCTKQVIN